MNLSENVEVIGRDQQEGGALFIRLISPTDRDKAQEAMRVELRQRLPLGQEFKYIGLFAGPLKQFLSDYIDVGHALKLTYSPLNKERFYTAMKQKGDYDNEALDIYFDAFYTLRKQGKIPDSIYKPYTYVPDDSTVGEKAIKYGVNAIVIGGVAYLLIKTIIFSGPTLISTYTKGAGRRRRGRLSLGQR